MRSEELYDLTPREFGNCVDGFEELRAFDDRQAWERMRLQTTALINIHTKRKVSPEKLFKFEWDKKGKEKHIFDPERAKAMHKKLGIKGKLITLE